MVLLSFFQLSVGKLVPPQNGPWLLPFNYSFVHLPFLTLQFEVLSGLLQQRKAENANNRHPTAKTTFHEHINYGRKVQDNSVSLVTRYGLEGPGIETHWGVRFSAPVQTALEPTQPPKKWVPCLSRG
jgi:hypothetical protein